MRLIAKVTPRKEVLADVKNLLRSPKFPRLNIVAKLAGEGKPIMLDLSYSTILGYSKASLETTFKVLTENLSNQQINDIFGTDYTPKGLSNASMNILNKSIKLHQKEAFAEGMTEPSFVDMSLVFTAELIV